MKASRVTWPGRSGPYVAGGSVSPPQGGKPESTDRRHPVLSNPFAGPHSVALLWFRDLFRGAGRNNHAGPTFLDHSREPPESTRDTGFIAFARIRKRPRASVPVHVAFVRRPHLLFTRSLSLSSLLSNLKINACRVQQSEQRRQLSFFSSYGFQREEEGGEGEEEEDEEKRRRVRRRRGGGLGFEGFRGGTFRVSIPLDDWKEEMLSGGSMRKSFKDSLKVLEADIQHANTFCRRSILASISREREKPGSPTCYSSSGPLRNPSPVGDSFSSCWENVSHAGQRNKATNSRSQSCPFCRDSLKRVDSGDLWVYVDHRDVVDMAVLTRDNIRRLIMYIKKLPVVVPESVIDAYDSHVR
ncbi:hypothetical protein BHM03_00036947 [Ensete ventricosum]|uniref:RING-type domain-containing protein n=1 Tax=Ensete ventricosum TaxID=4639 RepID=A0A445MJQ8_ENSVE|nr:hypothetical protein BHM03_00036947 [Ensete ventricosum]